MANKCSVPLWWKAVGWAAKRHEGQQRKDKATPYVSHPFRAAMIIRDVFGIDDPIVLTAALLHDTIEDTDTDYDDVAVDFGNEVADIVGQVTKDKRLPGKQRDELYYEKLASASWGAKVVKLADTYDNLCDAATLADPTRTFWKGQKVLDTIGDDPRLLNPARLLRDLLQARAGK